jgi:XTP/dITP diphosphohydrolase
VVPEETEDSLEGNALLKARYVHKTYGYSCFSDDTGLMVDALQGAPGVHSARYAGLDNNSNANMDKLLRILDHNKDRSAHFKTVIALIYEDKEYLFQSILEGVITHKKKGSLGFGYDPIFRPKGFDKTLAEMSLNEKNKISHRGQAFSQLLDFLSAPDI